MPIESHVDASANKETLDPETVKEAPLIIGKLCEVARDMEARNEELEP